MYYNEHDKRDEKKADENTHKHMFVVLDGCAKAVCHTRKDADVIAAMFDGNVAEVPVVTFQRR